MPAFDIVNTIAHDIMCARHAENRKSQRECNVSVRVFLSSDLFDQFMNEVQPHQLDANWRYGQPVKFCGANIYHTVSGAGLIHVAAKVVGSEEGTIIDTGGL